MNGDPTNPDPMQTDPMQTDPMQTGPMRTGPIHPMEDRLRRALAARAESIGPEHLSYGPPPVAARPREGRDRGPWIVTGAALAAAAAAASVFVLTGGQVPGLGDGGATVAGPASSSSASITASAPSITAPPPTAGASQTATGPATPAGSPSAALATGSAAATPTSGESTLPGTGTASATPVCRPDQMSAFVLPDTDSRRHGGGMNHNGATVAVTNVGPAPCRLYGYLGIGFYAGNTQISQDPNVRGDTWYVTDPGPTSIVLVTGASAYADVDWTSADGVQPAAPADRMKIILPDQKVQIEIPAEATIGGDRTLRVTALSQTPTPMKG